MFCWFFKKKKSEGGVPLIPNVLLSSDAISQYIDYYHSLLEPLFFQVLNTPVEKRNNRVRHSFWNNVPFLNGGLFEPHLYDYYEIYYESGLSKYINTLKIPDSWFLDLFKIFEIYNFTIDESTSIDIDISVDPEMLGRIFENLLAEINPETGETARKSTGSYYTPRPIVEYMVDESLKQYLLSQISTLVKGGEGGFLDENKLNKLLSYGDYEIDLTESEKDAIIDALDRLKIIDPACGSGAFPMGILHKMLLILQKIDPQSKKWLSRKLARIDNKLLRHEVEAKLKRENWDYVHKRGIIQGSIYGVDIQPIAVEISKLRFFLSLIVDEKIDDDKPNRGVVPLSNLEFKFVAANSLIRLPKAEGGLAESHKDIEKLKEFRDAYFTSYGDEKRNIEEQFKETQRRMFLHALNWQATGSQTYKLPEWNPFSDKASSWFDPEWMFGVRDGFDIVITNPPYGANIDSALSILYPIYIEVIQNYAEIYKMFFLCGMSMLNNNGMLSFITPNTYLSQPRYKDLRKFMLRFNIVRIINLGEGVFEGVVPVCLTFLRNKFPETSYFFADVSERSKFSGNLSDSRFLEIPLARVHSFKDLSLYFTDELRNNQVYFDAALEIKDAGIQYHRTGIGLKKKGGNDLYERLFSSNHKAFQEARPVWYGKLINRYYMAERTDEFFNLNYRDVLRDKESVSFTIEAFKVTPKII